MADHLFKCEDTYYKVVPNDAGCEACAAWSSVVPRTMCNKLNRAVMGKSPDWEPPTFIWEYCIKEQRIFVEVDPLYLDLLKAKEMTNEYGFDKKQSKP